jgi:hypothetical protein
VSSHASIAEYVVSRLLEDEAPSGLSPDEFMAGYKQGGKIGPIPTEDEVSEYNILRVVKLLDRYYLVLWDTGNHEGNHSYVGYRFMAGNKILFQGEDLGIPGHEAIDSDDTIRDLIGWLTLKPGDTDEEYFEKYTPEQLAFAESDDAQEIQDRYGRATSEPDEEGYYPPEAFQDLPGFEHGE